MIPQDGTVKNSKHREQQATDTTSSRPEWLKFNVEHPVRRHGSGQDNKRIEVTPPKEIGEDTQTCIIIFFSNLPALTNRVKTYERNTSIENCNFRKQILRQFQCSVLGNC